MDWLKLLKHRIRLAQEVSAADWLALIEAWWLLLFFRLALRVASYDRLDDSTRAEEIPARRSARADAEKLRKLIHYAAQIHLVPMTCLVQSLALQKMLRARNIPAQIKIGAQKTQGLLRAHAWVEVDQRPVGETGDVVERFSVLAAVDKQ